MKSESAKNIISLALLELMKDKELKKITISELVKKAGVSRNTYYYHFYDIEDVINYMISEFFKEFDEITIKFTSLMNEKINDFKEMSYQIELEHCRLFYKHRQFLSICYSQGRGRQIMLEFIEHLAHTRSMMDYYVEDTNANVQQLKRDIFYEYYSYKMSLGYYSALECWYSRNFVDTPEEVASYLFQGDQLLSNHFYFVVDPKKKMKK